MAHHWSGENSQMSPEEFKKLFVKKGEDVAGATGKFPDGKMDPLDEGEIQMRMTTIDKRIVIDFGKPITSIGFTRDEAIGLGQAILDRAFKL